MEYETAENGTVATLTLGGCLTIEHAARLKEVMTPLLSDSTEVVVCLRNVSCMDLSCIQLLCAANRSFSGDHQKLVPDIQSGEVVRSALKDAGFFPDGACCEQFCETCFWKGETA